jgi:hypothetical protein
MDILIILNDNTNASIANSISIANTILIDIGIDKTTDIIKYKYLDDDKYDLIICDDFLKSIELCNNNLMHYGQLYIINVIEKFINFVRLCDYSLIRELYTNVEDRLSIEIESQKVITNMCKIDVITEMIKIENIPILKITKK